MSIARRQPSFVAALFGCVLLLIVACSRADGSGPDVARDEAIGKAVKELGSSKFATREAATKKLLEIGEPAVPALEDARMSARLEVRRRSQWLLERILVFRVTPQTPRMLSLVRDWSFSEQNHARVIQDLIEEGEAALPVLKGLLRLSQDEIVRERLRIAILDVRRQGIWPALEEGDLQKAEHLLREARTHSEVMRHYAVFFLLTGRIEQEIERLRSELTELENASPSSDQQRLAEVLVYCLRAAGRHAEALDLGRTIASRMWLDGLLVENGRWSELAENRATWPSASTQRLRPGWRLRPVRDKGFRASCLRMAGRRSDCDRVLAEIVRDARTLNPNVQWFDLRAYPTMLLINERPDAAVNVMADHAAKSHADRAMTIKLLCLQDRHAQAFELAALSTPDATKRAQIIAEHAKQQAGLGERDAAVALLSPPIERAATDSAPSTRTLIKTLIAIGNVSDGLKHVARRLEKAVTDPARRTELQAVYENPAHFGRPPSSPTWLKPYRNTGEIQRLWSLIPDCYPEDPPDWQLARLRHLLGLPVEHEWDHDDRLATAERLAETARQLDAADVETALPAIAYALMRLKQGDRARQMLSEAIEKTDSTAMIQRYADSLAADSKWDAAVKWYARASKKVPENAFYEFAIAYCQLRSGDETATVRMDRACLPFLGKLTERSRAIDDFVRDRNWKDAQVRLARIAFNIHETGSHHILNAAGTLGNSVNLSDPRRAVEMWELLQLALTSPTILRYIPAFEQILLTHETLHRIKARDLAKRGRIVELLAAAEASRRTLPGGVSIALECVPPLRAAGRDDEADRLLEQITTVNQRVLEQYPNSHRHHYRLARLTAELDWQPEEGLRHAQRAAELAPDNTAYQAVLTKLLGDAVD